MGYDSAIKKNEILICNNVDGPRDYYAVISSIWNLKKFLKCMYIIKQQKTHRYRVKTSANHRGEGSGVGQDNHYV